jgi:hypothetical protein
MQATVNEGSISVSLINVAFGDGGSDLEDLAMTTLLGGNLTQSDGGAVLSTTLVKDS